MSNQDVNNRIVSEQEAKDIVKRALDSIHKRKYKELEVVSTDKIEIVTIRHGEKTRTFGGTVRAIEKIVSVNGEIHFKQWKRISSRTSDNSNTGRLIDELENSLFPKQSIPHKQSDIQLKEPKKNNLFSRILHTMKEGLRFLFAVDNTHCRFAIVPLPSKQETLLYTQRLEQIEQLLAEGYQVTIVQENSQTKCERKCQ